MASWTKRGLAADRMQRLLHGNIFQHVQSLAKGLIRGSQRLFEVSGRGHEYRSLHLVLTQVAGPGGTEPVFINRVGNGRWNLPTEQGVNRRAVA